MADRGLLVRLYSQLDTVEVRALLAEDRRLAVLVESALRRCRELTEQRRSLEAQVWAAGITAVVERRRRERLAAREHQRERISALARTLGNGPSAKGLAELLSHAATLQPDVTGRLLDIVENALVVKETNYQ